MNTTLLITHATLLNGDGSVSSPVEILIHNGLIVDIGSGLSHAYASLIKSSLSNHSVIDAQLRYVTPGLVDMHSHAGTDSWPEFSATSDTNEISGSATTPYLKSIDGFNPDDLAIPIINRVRVLAYR